jgi:hypothetical protein
MLEVTFKSNKNDTTKTIQTNVPVKDSPPCPPARTIFISPKEPQHGKYNRKVD